jgi:hypothetical protein
MRASRLSVVIVVAPSLTVATPALSTLAFVLLAPQKLFWCRCGADGVCPSAHHL